MYEAILQTTDRPFRATPDERFYFPYDSVEQARQTLARVVRRAEGPAMVMGGSGLGKTMLAQVVANDLSDQFDVVRLYAARLCSRRALLQSMLFELQLPYRDLSEGELRLSLMNRMERSPECAPSGLLLMVDEAHTLPVKLLEELRLITNFSRNGEPRARLILVGSLALEDIFARPQLDSFNQRLAARCYLQPMNRQQTHSFIVHQLRCISAEPSDVITRDAMDSVYSASEGIPRLANQIMDHSLVLAITGGQSPISVALVEEAWSDLQQLPAPWHGSPESSPAAGIEFGALEEDDIAAEMPAETDFKVPAGTRGESSPVTAPNCNLDDEFHRSHSASSNFHFEADWLAPVEAAPTAVQEVSSDARSPESAPEINEFEMLVIQDESLDELHALADSSRVIGGPWGSSLMVSASDAAAFEEATPIDDAPARPLALAPLPPAPANNPFGEDFDEEFAIESPAHRVWASQYNSAEPNPPAAAYPAESVKCMEVGEQEALEQIAQMQHALDAAQPEVEAQPKVIFQALDHSIPNAAEQEHLWQVDTASTRAASEETLHWEVEDLISQLNFSAFSMELESVEQIAIDYARSAAPAPIHVFGQAHSENDLPIYSMRERAPDEADSFLEDDRELLILEEDIPLSVRLSRVPQAATRTEAQAYSQLFTKLRT